MDSISDDQLIKLQSALTASDPAALLTCLIILFPSERQGNFVTAVAQLGKRDTQRAEQLFRVGVALYEKHFPDEHSGGLSAMCGLARLLGEQNREVEMSVFLDDVYPLVLRAARGIGEKVEEHQGNGKVAALKILRNGH